MIESRHLGFTTKATSVPVDAWRVALFCKAIGEVDVVYFNHEAAIQAGFPACPVPPTFLKALESEHFNSAALLEMLKIPVHRVLHAEQAFEFFAPVFAGDVVEISRTLRNAYDKRLGELTFLEIDTHFHVRGVQVCRSVQTVLVRNPKEVMA